MSKRPDNNAITELMQRVSILEAKFSGLELQFINLKNGYISASHRQSGLQKVMNDLRVMMQDVDEDVRHPKELDPMQRALELVQRGKQSQ